MLMRRGVCDVCVNPLYSYLMLAIGLTPLALGCAPADSDADGVPVPLDCADDDPEIHPNAVERCDGLDNNCDGVVDRDAVDQRTFYADIDGDGFGDPAAPIQACTVPKGAVLEATDCAPTDPASHPNAQEQVTDGVDNNCNGQVDEMVCPEAPEPKQYAALLGAPVPHTFCTPKPDDGQCAPASTVRPHRLIRAYQKVNPRDPISALGAPQVQWRVRGDVCGPTARRPQECCYVFTAEARVTWSPEALNGSGELGTSGPIKPVHGRPLRVHGTPRVATIVSQGAWLDTSQTDATALTPEQRSRVGTHWLVAATMEHASVASFAMFTMDLMALGAPSEMIEQAVQAQQDEVNHAKACFTLASQYLDAPHGPGPLCLSGVTVGTHTLEEVLVQTLRDGCINETLAAAEARWLLARVQDVALREILSTIAEEEAAHAALAWRFVRWALQQNPALAQTLTRVIQDQAQSMAQAQGCDGEDAWMAAYGCMPAKERHSYVRRARCVQ